MPGKDLLFRVLFLSPSFRLLSCGLSWIPFCLWTPQTLHTSTTFNHRLFSSYSHDHAFTLHRLTDSHQSFKTGTSSPSLSLVVVTWTSPSFPLQIQVVPWNVKDNVYIMQQSDISTGDAAFKDWSRTIFVSPLHGKMTAFSLATIMANVFGPVSMAQINTDKYGYPTGTFINDGPSPFFSSSLCRNWNGVVFGFP